MREFPNLSAPEMARRTDVSPSFVYWRRHSSWRATLEPILPEKWQATREHPNFSDTFGHRVCVDSRENANPRNYL
jgi:hypothetical protein